MLEDAVLFEKKLKHRRSVEAAPPNSCWSPEAGVSTPRSLTCYSRHLL